MRPEDAIEDTRYAICPVCNGMGCGECHGLGEVPEYLAEYLDECLAEEEDDDLRGGLSCG